MLWDTGWIETGLVAKRWADVKEVRYVLELEQYRNKTPKRA
jgi:hypothetical protein